MPDIENLIETKPAPEASFEIAGGKKLNEMSMGKLKEDGQYIHDESAINYSDALEDKNLIQDSIDAFIILTTVETLSISHAVPVELAGNIVDYSALDYIKNDLVYGKGDL